MEENVLDNNEGNTFNREDSLKEIDNNSIKHGSLKYYLMNEKKILESLVLISITFSTTFFQRKYLFSIVFIFSILINIQKIWLIYVYSKRKVLFGLKLISYCLFHYFFFKTNNPFYQFFFHWLPFQNFCRGFLMIRTFSLVINTLYQGLEPESKKTIKNNCADIEKIIFERIIFKKENFKNPKLYYLMIILILSLIKVSIFIFDQQFSYLFIDKKKLNNQTYYIAANLFNNEIILQDWKSEMMKLIQYLGPKNCYVSIVENADSTDKTAILLKEFEGELNKIGVKNRIVIDKVVEKENYERIVFLSILRNAALQFLYEIPNLDFDTTRVLFFNDIIFSYKDIIKLIDTNNGDYDLACGMDFYSHFYDTWVSMGVDANYFRHYFPYFINSVAVDQVLNNDYIRVNSCWNGVVSIKAKPFENYNVYFRFSNKLRQSECMLLNIDLWKKGYGKIILNPKLKFAYEYYYYYMNKYFYPWTKNLFTYFYYYFIYIFEQEDHNIVNFKDNYLQLPKELLYALNYISID